MDIWPYSQRQSGAVNDLEHEYLWAALGDGILPGQAANALSVSVNGGTWTVQPGRILAAGHVVDIDAVQSGAVPGGSISTRRCVVAIFVDRTSTPWTYGATLVLGTPGGGRPALANSRTGRYEVGLRDFEVAPNGAVTVLPDNRPRLANAGLQMPPSVEVEQDADEQFSYSGFQNGSSICATTFIAPPSGRVMVHLYARGHGTATDSAVFAFSIRKGNSGGPVVHNPTTYDGPIIEGVASLGIGTSKLVTGLAAGESYYIRTAQRSTTQGVAVSVGHRRLTVIPLAS